MNQLNMQVSFTITGADDAVRASRILDAIKMEYIGPEADVIETAPVEPEKPAQRRTRAARTAPAVDPVDAYNAKAAATGAATIPAEASQPSPEPQADASAPEQATAAAASPESQPEAPVAGADTRTTDELLAALRDTARAKGGAWLRPILDQYKVDKLSSLTDDQKREVLAS